MPDSKDNKNDSQDPIMNRVGVDHYIPEDMVIHYADNISLVFAEGTFFLTFFQVEPPIIFDIGEAADVERVRSRAISRLAMKPRDMKVMAEAIDRLLKNFSEIVEADK